MFKRVRNDKKGYLLLVGKKTEENNEKYRLELDKYLMRTNTFFQRNNNFTFNVYMYICCQLALFIVLLDELNLF